MPAPSHKDSYTRFYRVWSNMKSRCFNKNHREYKFYGGRGITVCDRWLKYENFKSDMFFLYQQAGGGQNIPGKRNTISLDRENNNGNYEPDNCRWATLETQFNNRRTSKPITMGNETKTLAQWIRHYGLKRSTVLQRYYGLKWPLEESLNIIPHKRGVKYVSSL